MGEETPSAANVFDDYRRLLFSIAYRMLGSLADAEDIVQETFVRWQQASSGAVRDPRSFLVTIVSRLFINHLHSARVRREEYFGEWLPEPVITWDRNGEPSAEARIDGSLSVASLMLLQRLNPTERARAIFLLREVFEYEYDEIAAILKVSQSNCRQILRRARQHVAEVRHASMRRFRSAKSFCMRS
jgi:RNA polymerase sigma-70 factor, ECF subfamily